MKSRREQERLQET